MRIVVVSDSHGNTISLKKVLDNIGSFDAIIHLGDIARDVDFLEEEFYDTPVYSVLGNNDFLRYGDFEKTITIDNIKIFICHGHTLSVSSGTERLIDKAKREGVSVALFGHTHHAMMEYADGILVINPGSTSRPRGEKPSFAIIETDNGKANGVIVDWML